MNARTVLRSPYVWGFVIGIVTLTLIRPLLRHIPEPPPVLSELPEFSLVGVDGKPFGSAELRGQVYVVNFWYAGCPPCRVEAPDLAALSTEYDTVPFLGVNISDSEAVALTFADEFGIVHGNGDLSRHKGDIRAGIVHQGQQDVGSRSARKRYGARDRPERSDSASTRQRVASHGQSAAPDPDR